MDIKKLQTVVVDALEDVKGQEIVLFDTTHLTSLFDRIAVVSGTSNRQTKALAASVRDKVKAAGGDVVGLEGEDTGEWVLVDLGDMIVHIMQPAIRQYYHLEEIWGEKPVRLRLGAAKPIMPMKAPTAAKKAAPSPSLRRSSAVKTAERDAKRESDAAKKTPAKKAAAKSATARSAAGKAALKTGAGKSAAGKTAAKKASAKKAAAKSPARKA